MFGSASWKDYYNDLYRRLSELKARIEEHLNQEPNLDKFKLEILAQLKTEVDRLQFWVEARIKAIETTSNKPIDESKLNELIDQRIKSIPNPEIPAIPDIKPLEDRVVVLENKPNPEIQTIDTKPIEERITALENKPPFEMPKIDLNPIENRVSSLERVFSSLDERVFGLMKESNKDHLEGLIEPMKNKQEKFIEIFKREYGKLLASGVKGEEYNTARAIFNALKELDKEE
jgi:hypothetical protein